MSLHVALLRAVNVGGTGKIAMAALKTWAEGLGFTSVRTLLQSGNLVFDAGGKAGHALEALLEAEAASTLALRTTFLVRDRREWGEAIAANPFPQAARDDPGHLVLMALTQAPAAEAVKALKSAVKGPEVVAAGTRHLYITYPDGMGQSKLTIGLIEKMLGSRGTARNWNTVLKLETALKG